MITIEEPKLLYQKLVEGVKKAGQCGRPIIVSITSKVKYQDPILFFSACKDKKGTRIFWSDPNQELTLVGVGSELTFEANGTNRFSWVEKSWRESLKDAVIVQDEPIPGTGPTLLGGFSFDPLKEKTPLWKSFPDAKMNLPKFMLTNHKESSWLTENFFLKATDDPDLIAEIAMKERESLFNDGEDVSFLHNTYIKEEINPQSWMRIVREATESIKKNELEKVVLARELRIFADKPFSPEYTLSRLHKEQPLSYIFAFESMEDCFIGATPERLAKREKDNVLFTCLAGSMKRGNTAEEDEALGSDLMNDPKNRQEHQFVVDMIGEVAKTFCKDVCVPDGPVLLKSRHIQHLFTPIAAKGTDHSLLTIIEAMHPTPALGGFPKNAGIEKIRQVEELDRGWYASPIGWIDYNGNGEFAAAIRSALLQGSEASLFAGCGIVADSEELSEYEETRIKFQPMLSVLGEEKT